MSPAAATDTATAARADHRPTGMANGASTEDLVGLLARAEAECERAQLSARHARADGDEDLAAFFDELALNDRSVASRARLLLAARTS